MITVLLVWHETVWSSSFIESEYQKELQHDHHLNVKRWMLSPVEINFVSELSWSSFALTSEKVEMKLQFYETERPRSDLNELIFKLKFSISDVTFRELHGNEKSCQVGKEVN